MHSLPALFANSLHHAIHRSDLEAVRCVDMWQFDFVQTKSLSADLAIKMWVEVVIVVVVIIVVVMMMAVADFVADAARTVLDDVDEMIVGKQTQRAENNRLVDAHKRIFNFDERHRLVGLQHRPRHKNAVGGGSDAGGLEKFVY